MHFLIDKLIGPLAFVFVLGVTIFWHEFGHFITAKAFGMRVFVFSFGFGQRLFGFKWGDTDCRVSLIPLGGYVKLEGEPDDKISEDTSQIGDGRDFTSRPRWQRILVYLAGPAMNVALTLTVLFGIFAYGASIPDLSNTPIIGFVAPDSPAEKAGLQKGDELVALDDTPMQTWEDVLFYVVVRPNRPMRVRYLRSGDEREVSVVTRVLPEGQGDLGAIPLVRIGSVMQGKPADQAGMLPGDVILSLAGKPVFKFEDVPPIVKANEGQPIPVEIVRDDQRLTLSVTPREGIIGIGGGTIDVYRKYRPLRAFQEAAQLTVRMTGQTFTLLKQLVTASISPKNALQGPVGIYKTASEAAKTNFAHLILLVAQISISVGILNLFPLPPLDGGHLAILYIESIARRDLSMQAKTWIINAGAIAVLLLIATVLYFDISKMSWFQKLFAN
jgi:regulator of sigma E protease